MVNNHSTTITDNSDLKYPFNKLMRYKIYYEINGSSGTVHLHYRGIQGSDSGSIGCYKLSEENNMAVVHIQVLVPIKEIYLFSILENGTEKHVDAKITLQDGDLVGVGCIASVRGSSVAPKLEFTIGEEDMTETAIATKKVPSLSSESDLIVFNTEKKLSLVFDRFDPTYHEKTVKCTAKVKGYPTEMKTAVLNVKYTPIISCVQKIYSLQFGASVTFSCNVNSNPVAKVKWQKGNQDDAEGMVIMERVLADKQIQVNATIANLQPSHFTGYTFTATNTIGTATEVITLEEYKLEEVDDESSEESSPNEVEMVVEKSVEIELNAPIPEEYQPADENIIRPEIPERVIEKESRHLYELVKSSVAAPTAKAAYASRVGSLCQVILLVLIITMIRCC